MSNLLHIDNSDRLIASQWDANAKCRLAELSSQRDETYEKILCPLLHRLVDGSSPGRRVLDVGCGLGFFANFLQRRGYNVTGVDLAPGCIAIARENFPSIPFYQCNVSELTGVGSFDACVANMVLHNVPDIGAFAAAIFNLLKSQGVFVGCLPHPVHWFTKRLKAVAQFSDLGRAAYLAPFKIRNSVVHPAPFLYFHRNCDDYWQALSAVGFSEVGAVSFDDAMNIPDDLVFFAAKKP